MALHISQSCQYASPHTSQSLLTEPHHPAPLHFSQSPLLASPCSAPLLSTATIRYISYLSMETHQSVSYLSSAPIHSASHLSIGTKQPITQHIAPLDQNKSFRFSPVQYSRSHRAMASLNETLRFSQSRQTSPFSHVSLNRFTSSYAASVLSIEPDRR